MLISPMYSARSSTAIPTAKSTIFSHGPTPELSPSKPWPENSGYQPSAKKAAVKIPARIKKQLQVQQRQPLGRLPVRDLVTTRRLTPIAAMACQKGIKLLSD